MSPLGWSNNGPGRKWNLQFGNGTVITGILVNVSAELCETVDEARGLMWVSGVEFENDL